MLKRPLQQDESLLIDIHKARQQPDTLHIWWLGQSGFLVHYNRRFVLFDPYLSDSLTQKYDNTSKPHVRISECVIGPDWLDMVDVVTSSHNHTDHLDADTLLPLLEASPLMQFVVPKANVAFASHRLQLTADWFIGLTDGQSEKVRDFVFHGVPAAHNELDRDADGHCKFMGFVVEIGPYRVYHSGDTLWYDGIVDILEPFNIDVALLPINGNKPERQVAGNLTADEAARLGRMIGAKLVIPHHYDMFEFNTADPADFVQACDQHGTPYRVLQLGERLALDW